MYCRFRRHRLRDNRGAAYVLALTTLLVGMSFALAMLRAVGAYFAAEDFNRRKQTALNLAEAGVDYAFWQVHYQNRNLPYDSGVVQLNTGSFQVTVSDDGSRDPSTMLITATGTTTGDRRIVKRVTLGLLPYRYALCENGNLVCDRNVTCVSGSGGIRANGSINMTNASTFINTGAWATGSINASGTVTPRYPNSPPVAFPNINYDYYGSIATQVYSGNRTFYGLDYSGRTALILVNGNVDISGYYSGACTMVATGDITVSGSLYPANSASYLALITTGSISITGTAGWVDAVLYAHAPGGSGRIRIRRSTTVNGTMAADDYVFESSFSMARYSSFDLALMRQLRLPGA